MLKAMLSRIKKFSPLELFQFQMNTLPIWTKWDVGWTLVSGQSFAEGLTRWWQRKSTARFIVMFYQAQFYCTASHGCCWVQVGQNVPRAVEPSIPASYPHAKVGSVHGRSGIVSLSVSSCVVAVVEYALSCPSLPKF